MITIQIVNKSMPMASYNIYDNSKIHWKQLNRLHIAIVISYIVINYCQLTKMFNFNLIEIIKKKYFTS